MDILLNTNYSKRIFYAFLYVIFLYVFFSCTTYKAQYGKNIANPIEKKQDNTEVSHRFYLIGDAGNADEFPSRQTLDLFNKRISGADKNSTLIFLGDNIYDSGMPADKEHQERQLAEEKLIYQLEVAQNFKGKTVFISGNHDWYHGIE